MRLTADIKALLCAARISNRALSLTHSLCLPVVRTSGSRTHSRVGKVESYLSVVSIVVLRIVESISLLDCYFVEGTIMNGCVNNIVSVSADQNNLRLSKISSPWKLEM